MILIAECGSTKCDWCLISESHRQEFTSPGLNPALSSDSEIHQVLISDVIPKICAYEIESLFFYGAGIRAQTKSRMFSILSLALNATVVEVNTDILAAARSLCGTTEGIVGIMGTGSNSCVYDGNRIVEQFFSPGYFFGDEGGGAYIGKIFINDYLRNRLPENIKQEVEDEYKLNRDSVMENIYRKPYPNRYMAGFMPFIHKRITDEYMRNVVRESVSAFFDLQLSTLNFPASYDLFFTGSVAWVFSDFIKEEAGKRNMNIRKIVKSPLEGLVKYHLDFKG